MRVTLALWVGLLAACAGTAGVWFPREQQTGSRWSEHVVNEETIRIEHEDGTVDVARGYAELRARVRLLDAETGHAEIELLMLVVDGEHLSVPPPFRANLGQRGSAEGGGSVVEPRIEALIDWYLLAASSTPPHDRDGFLVAGSEEVHAPTALDAQRLGENNCAEAPSYIEARTNAGQPLDLDGFQCIVVTTFETARPCALRNPTSTVESAELSELSWSSTRWIPTDRAVPVLRDERRIHHRARAVDEYGRPCTVVRVVELTVTREPQ